MEGSRRLAIVPRHQEGFRPKVIGMGILVGDREVVTCTTLSMLQLGMGGSTNRGTGSCGSASHSWEGSVCVNGIVDRERYFRQDRAEEGKLTDIAVVRLPGPAQKSDEPALRANEVPWKSAGKAVLRKHDDDTAVRVFGFRQKELPAGGWECHPNGEIVESKVLGSLPGGRVYFEGIRSTGAASNPASAGPASTTPSRGPSSGWWSWQARRSVRAMPSSLTWLQCKRHLVGCPISNDLVIRPLAGALCAVLATLGMVKSVRTVMVLKFGSQIEIAYDSVISSAKWINSVLCTFAITAGAMILVKAMGATEYKWNDVKFTINNSWFIFLMLICAYAYATHVFADAARELWRSASGDKGMEAFRKNYSHEWIVFSWYDTPSAIPPRRKSCDVPRPLSRPRNGPPYRHTCIVVRRNAVICDANSQSHCALYACVVYHNLGMAYNNRLGGFSFRTRSAKRSSTIPLLFRRMECTGLSRNHYTSSVYSAVGALPPPTGKDFSDAVRLILAVVTLGLVMFFVAIVPLLLWYMA